MKFKCLWSALFVVGTVSDPWCTPTQRYDVRKFPPRCLDCPGIFPNPVRLSSISTRVRNQRTTKFSPGLPHNQTCGCWRGGGNTVIDLSLNTSWVVSGLVFQTDHTRWLKRFNVSASNDNITFLDWGVFSPRNFTDASTVLFRYPIRATFFRLLIVEYVNHMINVTNGFPVRVNALVGDSEPFGCDCATLSTGECCPGGNMKVENDTCVVCMDPSDINTVMIDGCGRCKPGTSPVNLRCVPVTPVDATMNGLSVSKAVSNEDKWSVQIDVASGGSGLVLFLTAGESLPCATPFSSSACFASFPHDFIPVAWDLNLTETSGLVPIARITKAINPQYLQFDRGRHVLVMTEETIRSWAICSESRCTGHLGALFISSFDSTPRFLAGAIRQPLIFDITALSSMVYGFSRSLNPTAIEIHHFMDTNQYQLVFLAGVTYVQWDDNPDRVAVNGGFLALPPPAVWSFMRVFSGDKQFCVSPSIVRKHSALTAEFIKDTTWINIAYGFALKSTPEPGDSEQLTTISGFSNQPMRLMRLASEAKGLTTVYTTSRGFITDPRHALDLVVACNGMMDIQTMVDWLGSALGLMDQNVESFVNETCSRVHLGTVSKLYWLVPYRPIGTTRRERLDVNVMVDFV